MGRVLVAAIVAAVVVFAWGFVAWTQLELYDFAFKSLPNEATLVRSMRVSIPETGAYWFPMPADKDDPAAMEDFKGRHESGPIGMLLYREQGGPVMDPAVLGRGFAIYLAAALILSTIVYGLRLRWFFFRLAFVVLMVIFAMLISHISTWTWFMHPDKYMLALIIDGLVGWTLAGVCIAGIVKSPPAAI